MIHLPCGAKYTVPKIYNKTPLFQSLYASFSLQETTSTSTYTFMEKYLIALAHCLGSLPWLIYYLLTINRNKRPGHYSLITY